MKLLQIKNGSTVIAELITDQINAEQDFYTLWDAKPVAPYTDKELHDQLGDLAIIKPNTLTLLKTKITTLGYTLFSKSPNGSFNVTQLV